MGAQDGGLRSSFADELKKYMQLQSRAYRFIPIETGSVSVGIPDARFESSNREWWVEFKSWNLVGPLTKDKVLDLLSPAQRSFRTLSHHLSVEHFVVIRRKIMRDDEKYMVINSQGVSILTNSLRTLIAAMVDG